MVAGGRRVMLRVLAITRGEDRRNGGQTERIREAASIEPVAMGRSEKRGLFIRCALSTMA
jgi:hypothetical protein